MITVRRMVVAGAVAAGALVMVAAAAFACTALPTGTLNQLTGAPGSSVQFSGTIWEPALGPIDVRWNSLNGPILAQVTPNAQSNLGPVSITVPANAAPGYYFLAVAPDRAPAGTTTVRVPFQVTGAAPASGPQPRVLLPSTAPASSHAGVGALALLAAMGLAGLGLFGVGGVSLARSARRAPRTSPAPSLRRR